MDNSIISAVRQVESQVNKENQTVKQQTESRSNFKTFNEELQFCDNEKQLDEQLETLNNTLRNENKKIEVNFKLFSIAIKNLIDNAVKYSPNKEVTIKVSKK